MGDRYRCNRNPNCVRILGHAGACTACPSAATLDWDHTHRTINTQVKDTATLICLDFPTPPYADLNDPEPTP